MKFVVHPLKKITHFVNIKNRIIYTSNKMDVSYKTAYKTGTIDGFIDGIHLKEYIPLYTNNGYLDGYCNGYSYAIKSSE